MKVIDLFIESIVVTNKSRVKDKGAILLTRRLNGQYEESMEVDKLPFANYQKIS